MERHQSDIIINPAKLLVILLQSGTTGNEANGRTVDINKSFLHRTRGSDRLQVDVEPTVAWDNDELFAKRTKGILFFHYLTQLLDVCNWNAGHGFAGAANTKIISRFSAFIFFMRRGSFCQRQNCIKFFALHAYNMAFQGTAVDFSALLSRQFATPWS